MAGLWEGESCEKREMGKWDQQKVDLVRNNGGARLTSVLSGK